jgi:hypothetical protein
MRKPVVLSFAGVLLFASLASAGGDAPFNFSFTAPGGPIPEVLPPGETEGISVFPLVMDIPRITRIDSLELLLTGLTHTEPADLDVYLIDPFGNTLEVMTDKGGAGSVTGLNLIFNDTGPALPPDGSALLPGATYHTEGSAGLGMYVGGSGGTDSWILLIIDDSLADRGSLESWTLRGTGVPEPVTLSLLALGALTFLRRRRA